MLLESVSASKWLACCLLDPNVPGSEQGDNHLLAETDFFFLDSTLFVNCNPLFLDLTHYF